MSIEVVVVDDDEMVDAGTIVKGSVFSKIDVLVEVVVSADQGAIEVADVSVQAAGADQVFAVNSLDADQLFGVLEDQGFHAEELVVVAITLVVTVTTTTVGFVDDFKEVTETVAAAKSFEIKSIFEINI